jgi:hypothetical protein
MSDYLLAFPRLALPPAMLELAVLLILELPPIDELAFESTVDGVVLVFIGRLAFIGLLAFPLFAFSAPQAKVNASIAMPTIAKSFLISPPS